MSEVNYYMLEIKERRIYYIDVKNISPREAKRFIEKMKDQFRKKKVEVNESAE